MAVRRIAVLGLSLLLIAGVLAGCRSGRVAPYAWQEDETDPRLSVRVPAGTPGAEEVPLREQVHPNGRAQILGEVEWPDPRLSCCPEGEEEEEEEFERNEISLFLGYTGVRAGDGTTVGLTYHRMLTRVIGLSVWGEYVFGDTQTPVVGGGFVFRPTEPSRIFLSAGVEFEENEDAEGLLRMGFAYKVGTLWGLEVFPGAYVDFVRNKEPVLLLGFEFGRQW